MSTTLKVLPKVRWFQHPCGCRNFLDPEWLVERSYSKCEFHKSEAGHSGLKHHEVMGAIKDGVVQHKIYEDELLDPLHEMKVCLSGEALRKEEETSCLEIGCGVGSYIPFLKKSGYSYTGIEPDDDLSDVLEGENIFFGTYEEFYQKIPFDLIFCAHAFEHMEDSPGMMAKAFSQLKPGGRLLLIVPNDDDPVNPDHLFFWNESSLRSALMRIGFQDIRMVSRQRVKHEKFIYATGLKP